MRASILILLSIWNPPPIYCAGIKRKWDEGIEGYHRSTRQPIAVDDLRKVYEKEHYQLQMKEANKDNILEWPFLEQKDISDYCLLCLHCIIPTLKTYDAIGTKMIEATLQYEIETTGDFSIKKNIVNIIKCERWNLPKKYYYITRAPETDCIYTLLRNPGGFVHIFNIINKHCGIEKLASNNAVTIYKERTKIFEKLHQWTGQPIAKEEYIREYEQEHKKLCEKEVKNNYLSWPYITEKNNLDEYCYQYLQGCNPRKTGNIKGIQIQKTLHYQKLHEKERTSVIVLTIKCVVSKQAVRKFYITRAPTNNCVYALIRRSQCKDENRPYVIIFKHCDFQNLEKSVFSGNTVIPHQNVLPKYEIKEESFHASENSSLPQHYMIKKESSETFESINFIQ